MSIFSTIRAKSITEHSIIELNEITPRRICFSSTHKDALRLEKGNYIGKFSLPFEDTIRAIFERETDLKLFPNLGNFWHSIKQGREVDLKKIEAFILKYQEIVFLRDCLDLSMALSENINEDNRLTYIGELEDRAKYKKDLAAIDELSKVISSFIENTPYYDSADIICAIPASAVGVENLPMALVDKLHCKAKNCSALLSWSVNKPPLKSMGFEEKWKTLNKVNLVIADNVKDKTIILIDDLYQSGLTMQYVAMKLKESGAKLIYGLSTVKARNNKAYV